MVNNIAEENNAHQVIRQISIKNIDSFPDHPYKVTDDAAMEQLAESIRVKGVISPCIVRPLKHGRYEMISGHRRMRACEIAGLDTVPAVVMDISRDEAVILMVESNFHRDKLLPSEKAFAYKMRLEAMKMQISRMRENQKKGRNYRGKPVEPQLEAASGHLENSYGIEREEIDRIGNAESRRHEHKKDILPTGSCQLGTRNQLNRSDQKLSESVGESARQIQRYIRLTELIPELLDMIDLGAIGLTTAVELSYIGIRQKDVYKCMEEYQCIPTQAQALRMKKLYADNKLTKYSIEEILMENKPNQEERIILHGERFQKLMPSHLHKKEYEDYIAAAIDHYNRFIRETNLAKAGK